jgi:catechol 2,3-dioxygenase
MPAQQQALTVAIIHGLSKAIYLDNPDGNGVELYWDRPQDNWPKNEDGLLQMVEKKVDLHGL